MTHEDRALSGRQPQAIRHAFAVLRCVAQQGPGTTARDVASALQISPATVYRLLNFLVAEEYLVRLADLRGFALGERVAELTGTDRLAVPAPPADAEASAERTSPVGRRDPRPVPDRLAAAVPR